MASRQAKRLSHLLSPGQIGGLSIRNRVIMAPMGSNLAQEDGHLGEPIKAYYEARARGGAGLIIVGVGAIAWPAGAGTPNQVGISGDAFLPDLRDLARRVQRHGARIAIQLQHAGKVAVRDIVAGRPLLVPSEPAPKASDLMNDLSSEELQVFISSYAASGGGPKYQVMTVADIAEITRRFADAAERAKRAGFDAVEIHAGHGYVLSSFLSPSGNQRTDGYGGSVENRARFLVEVLRAVRARVGDSFPVWCRIDAKEFRVEGGITLEDAKRTAELAEAAGADAIHVSAYGDSTKGVAFTDAPLVHQPCGFVDFTAAIKRRVRIPVIAVGRIEAEEADRVLGEGKADFVAMGRKLLAEPELVNKLDEGRPEDVRPCIYCYTCVAQIFLDRPVRCAVNPDTGLEFEQHQLAEATHKKRVLVIGGGPAGMEAARIAALRGHEVTLAEKASRLGGTLFFAAVAYPPNGRLIRWLETQVRKLPIAIRLGQEVTPERVNALAPDVAIVAAGATRDAPPIPGVERPNVLSGDDLRNLITGAGEKTAREKLSIFQRIVVGVGKLLQLTGNPERIRKATRLWMPLGRRVVILGGGLVGLELAEFLLERGREVTVLEESECLGKEMAPPRRWRTLYELRQHGVALHKQAQIEAITQAGVLWCDAQGEKSTALADNIVLATGTRDNRRLGDELKKQIPEVHLIGDCSGVSYIEGAMREATRVALSI